MSTPASPALPIRIAGALTNILKIYGVPDEECDGCIQQVLRMDYQSIGRRVLQDFKTYVHGVAEEQLKQYLIKQ